jgi:hypothetical protein
MTKAIVTSKERFAIRDMFEASDWLRPERRWVPVGYGTLFQSYASAQRWIDRGACGSVNANGAHVVPLEVLDGRVYLYRRVFDSAAKT